MSIENNLTYHMEKLQNFNEKEYECEIFLKMPFRYLRHPKKADLLAKQMSEKYLKFLIENVIKEIRKPIEHDYVMVDYSH